MKYPGEKDTIRKIIKAYRSSMKYMHDPKAYLESIYGVMTKLGNKPQGDFVSFAKDTIPDLRIVDNAMSHEDGYDSSYIRDCIGNLQKISQGTNNDRDTRSLFNGCTVSIYLLLREMDKTGVNHPHILF